MCARTHYNEACLPHRVFPYAINKFKVNFRLLFISGFSFRVYSFECQLSFLSTSYILLSYITRLLTRAHSQQAWIIRKEKKTRK